MIEVNLEHTREEFAESIKELDLRNPSGLGLSKESEKKFIDMLYFDDMRKLKEDNIKYQNTISDIEWVYLIENHDHLSATLELLDWKKKSNWISWHLYDTIVCINKLEKDIAEGKSRNLDFDNFFLQHCIKCLKDALTPSTYDFDRPNAFIYELAKSYLDRLRPSHRPAKQTIIKMIDTETEEVVETFKGRAAVIDATGIKKNRLSVCIKSVKDNPDCKAKWSAYKYENRKYYFAED